MTISIKRVSLVDPVQSALPALALAALIFVTSSAHGIGFSLTQIGGTAVNGRGVVGDTVVVAVDLTVGNNEVITGAFPTLAWDLEGGNVLDIESAQEGIGASLGSLILTPINSGYILTDSSSASASERNDRFFDDGTNFMDSTIGTTIMPAGFELHTPLTNDVAYSLEILANGFPGPASLRMGTATFRLASVGTTTLGFFRDQTSGFRTLAFGAEARIIDDTTVEYMDLPVSGFGFSELQITIIPEPSTALLMSIGLLGLAARRDRTAPVYRR